MHHMTANWCPIAREERDQLCFGVWGTVGSTGRWPEVVNLWELDGWDGLVANFEHELNHPGLQDPSLAEWWATAAQFRRGGVDRIVVPEPWTRPVTELTDAGVRGEVYAHELVTVPAGHGGGAPGRRPRAGRGRPRRAGHRQRRGVAGHRGQRLRGHPALGPAVLVGLGRLRAGLARPGEPRWATGARPTLGLGADWRRQLLVDAPLSPLRTGRQPQVEDRLPLDQL